MIYQGAFLLAALICFVIAAAKPQPGSRWGWIGMAVLVVFALLLKGKVI